MLLILYNTNAIFILMFLQSVTDPEIAAKRKIAKQVRKKEAKKRKKTEIYGKLPKSKKSRLEE